MTHNYLHARKPLLLHPRVVQMIVNLPKQKVYLRHNADVACLKCKTQSSAYKHDDRNNMHTTALRDLLARTPCRLPNIIAEIVQLF